MSHIKGQYELAMGAVRGQAPGTPSDPYNAAAQGAPVAGGCRCCACMNSSGRRRAHHSTEYYYLASASFGEYALAMGAVCGQAPGTPSGPYNAAAQGAPVAGGCAVGSNV
jgi:hypothetical protein